MTSGDGAGDGETVESQVCTCTTLCTEANKDTNCSLCGTDYTQCKISSSQPAEALVLEVGWEPEQRYAAYNGEPVAITVSGSLSGTTAESGTAVTVAITLSNAEADLLTIPDDNSFGFTLKDDNPSDGVKTLSFTVTAGESFNKTLTVSAPNAMQPTVFDVAATDVTATVTTADGSAAPVQVNFNNGATAASTLTFVETLPDENTPYGSVTGSAGSVDALTVTYVDKDGQPVARQEKAPTFTLWYQVGDDKAVEANEGSQPFDLTTLPEITTDSTDTTWIGSVAKDPLLPSKVLALDENNAVVEKNIRWFLKPSYPEGYYPNAGTLVQITEDNKETYPNLEVDQWYFIAGETPYEDDAITIDQYTSLTHNIYWADNGNAESKRPSLDEVSQLYELQFSLDGSSEYETLTTENMATLGLKEMPAPTMSELTGIWSLNWSNTLPSQVTYSDSTGSGASITRDVIWRYVPKGEVEAVKGYAMVEVTEENAGDYSSVTDQYGTYYVLEADLTFTARIYRGENDNDLDLSDAFYEQFYLEAAYTGDQKRCYQISYVKNQGNLISNKGEEAVDPDILTVTITHLWRYNLDNTRINYSLKEGTVETPGGTAPENSADGQLNHIEGLEEDDYFAISYDNSAVPSFSGVTDGVYSGGTLKLTLTGTTDYQATKEWLDDSETQRPTVEMELWRYREGEDYHTAAQVHKADGSLYTVTLSNEDKQRSNPFNFEDLPKYDAEGYRYIYVVREYLSEENADKYEQVFGKIDNDGSVTDKLPEGMENREDGNTWLYDGGTLSNRLKGTIPVSVTKEWKASSFQSDFGDVMVKLRLQYRHNEQENWNDTNTIYEMTDFYAENLTVSYTGYYPQYDDQGKALEYRWVEEAVYQDKNDDGTYSEIEKIEPNETDGVRTFTLKQNGRDVHYRSESITTTDNGVTHTQITNSIVNTINYEVTKTFNGGWNAETYKDKYTFALYRTTSGEGLEKYATFTIAKDKENIKVKKVSDIKDDAELDIDFINEWKVTISGLPEFNADGQVYEYLLLETDGTPVDSETTMDHDGNYHSTITNGPGTTNTIMVRKEWVDGSDIEHRQPVTITVYDKETKKPLIINDKVVSTVLGGAVEENSAITPWYDMVNIGGKTADQVYILETKVGETVINNTQAPPVYTNNQSGQTPQTPTRVAFATKDADDEALHQYEAFYSLEKIDADGSSTTGEEMNCFTVTNRRLGTVNLTVEKNWVDGDGTARDTLQQKIEAANLSLTVKLEFLSEPSLGLEDVYEITYDGYGNDAAGDTVTISEDNNTPILDNNKENPQQVDAIQNLDLKQKEQTIYFWNLPKYDAHGVSVRYTVKEVFVDAQGNEVDLNAADASENYQAVAAAYEDYRLSTSIGDYGVSGDHSEDQQTFILTNKLSATKDVSWYALWLDDFAYSEGTRPDIYLDIYAEQHIKNADGKVITQTVPVMEDYHWQVAEGAEHPEDFWTCTIEDLPKYDDLGYEIDYFALMETKVEASDFDYIKTNYGTEKVNSSENIHSCIIGDETRILEAEHFAEYVLNVQSDETGPPLYALQSGNTFINTIYDTISFSGEKLWQNLPDSYPLADLPTVTFTLKRWVDGYTDANPEDVATMTIKGDDWQNLNVNGHYIFTFAHTGDNEPASSVQGVTLQGTEEWLPRFDGEGRLYTYDIEESIDWGDNDAGKEEIDEKNPVFMLESTGQTLTNSYNGVQAQLSAKKYLTVAKNLAKYPAITMTLSRTYTTNDNDTSAIETVETITWSAADVEAAVKQEAASGTGEVTVERVFTFEDLPTYAPNGSKYVYTITEVKTELGGYDTWAAAGDPGADALQNSTDYANKTSVSGLTARDDETIDASFLNTPKDPSPDTIELTGTKVWNDLDNAFGLRPSELTITLERRANAQSGQDNAIGWQDVNIDGSTVQITWDKNVNNQWTYTITGLDRYAGTGMPWIYRVTETEPDPYTASGGGTASQKETDADGNVTMNNLTNSILTSTYFKKTWVNSEGEPITEDILGSGIELEVGYKLQVRVKDSADEWQDAGDFFAANISNGTATDLTTRTYSGTIRAALGDSKWNSSCYGPGDSFKNLPKMIPDKDKPDETISLEYRVVETGVKVYRTGETTPLLTQAYTVQEKDSDSYSYTVTSNQEGSDLFTPYYGSGKNSQPNNTTTHKNKLTTQSLTVKKVWEDNNNEGYVTRPTTSIDRYNWEVTFVIERSADGTNWETIPNEDDGKVTLYGINTDKEMEKTIDNLPKYAISSDGTLVAYQYRVRELQSDAMTEAGKERQPIDGGGTFHGGYTVSYSDDGLAVTNTLNTIDFHAVKKWNDGNASNRPEVTLELKYLKANGDPDDANDYKSFTTPAKVTLDGTAETETADHFYYEIASDKENVWKATWTKVPEVVPGGAVDADGNTIYKIFETVTDGYMSTSTTNGTMTTITNTPTVTPSVTKHWLGIIGKATNVTVELHQKDQNGADVKVGTVELNENNNWKADFDPQPKYDEKGNEYTYSVVETLIDGVNAEAAADEGGYGIAVDGDAATGFHVYNYEKGVLHVVKEWADAGDPDERPIDLELTLERTTETDPEENDWEPVTDASYTWDTSGGNYWTATFGQLPIVDNNGISYIYRVREPEVNGYELTDNTVVTTFDNVFIFRLRNVRSETIDIPVEKIWDDNNDNFGHRPDSITVALYRNGVATGQTLELKPNTLDNLVNFFTGGNAGWSGTFTGLDKFDENGNLIEYTVKEVVDPDSNWEQHYSISYDEKDDGTKVITNTAHGELEVSKTVEGEGGDPEKEFNFTATLSDDTINSTYGEMTFANGIATFTLKDGQTCTAEGLPAGLGYTVTETDANTGAYVTTVTGETGTIPAGDTAVAAFTNTAETIDIPVEKVWEDNDREYLRPAEITVKLLADGTETGETLTLNADNGWKDSFKDLNVTKDGQAITYTIEEVEVDGYRTTITGDAENGFVIINTRPTTPTPTPDPDDETVDVSGDKTWDDSNNQDGKRPESITIRLYANGVEVAQKVVTAVDNWHWDFSDLPKTEDGKDIVYTIKEDPVEGYTSTVHGYDVTNTCYDETVDVSGDKTWNDSDNQDGKRPESITIRLYANGVEVAQKVVTAADNWHWDFSDLPKTEDGKDIVYTIKEDPVEGYMTTVHGYDVANTYDDETVDVSGNKTWNDSDNQDGKRPESITIRLYANGVEVAQKVVTAADNWHWDFSDLPKTENGEDIVYTITEDAVSDYTSTVNGTNVTNTYTPGKTTVSVTKNWQDKNDQAGKRPDSITVKLFADSVDTGKTLVLNEDNNWTASFSDLDMYKDGQTIIYTIKEVTVDGYTTTISGDAVTGFVITNSTTTDTTPPADNPPAENPPSGTTPGTPSTGDDSHLALWLALMAAAAAGMAGCVMLLRRKRGDASKDD